MDGVSGLWPGKLADEAEGTGLLEDLERRQQSEWGRRLQASIPVSPGEVRGPGWSSRRYCSDVGQEPGSHCHKLFLVHFRIELSS